MTKHIAQEYQVLDEIDHIRRRTGMYAGSTSIQSGKEWIYDQASKRMVKKEISYIPALVKIFSEILDNAIDEARRAPDVLDSIRVEIHDDGSISIQDNGRGIPVEIHPQTKTYVATTVFSNLRAGSNFNDDEDQQLIGTNGVGSTLTNVLSISFKIESCDGKKLFKQEFFNGMRERTEPKIKSYDRNYTKITFTPDYAFFKLNGLDEDHKSRMIKKVVDAAATNTGIKFYMNGERIMLRSFEDYIALYADEYVFDDTGVWKVGVSSSDGFEQVSFVNSVETYQGGQHVDYVVRQIVDGVRSHIEKKAKVTVSPGDIRSHLRVYISASVNRPRFSSQTKENMVSTPSEWKTNWSCPDKLIQRLLKTTVIQSVLDWVAAKQAIEDEKLLKNANKDMTKFDPRKIEKFSDAYERNERSKCILFLSEGDTIFEGEMIVVQRAGSFQKIQIKDVCLNDLVLTHKNRLKPVIDISRKVIEGVKITTKFGDLIVSPEHRLVVYNTNTKAFIEERAKNINLKIHKLVKSKIVDVKLAEFSKIQTCDEKFPVKLIIDGLEDLFVSESHNLYVWNNSGYFEFTSCGDLDPSVHRITLQEEKEV